MNIMILTANPNSNGVIKLVDKLIDFGIEEIHFTQLDIYGKINRKVKNIFNKKVWLDGPIDYCRPNAESEISKTLNNQYSKDMEFAIDFIKKSSSIKIKNSYSSNLINYIKDNNIDLGIYKGLGILKKELISSFNIGILNSHMGELPKYKGMNVLEWALFNNENKIYVTHHFIDTGIDTGDIINSYEVEIGKIDTINILRQKARTVSIENIPETLRIIEYGCSQKQINSGKQYFTMQNDLKEILKNNFKNKFSNV